MTKNKTMQRCIAAVLAVVLLLGAYFFGRGVGRRQEANTTKRGAASLYVGSAEAKMSNPSYWLRRTGGDNKVQLNAGEIRALNRRIRAQKSSQMYDLEKEPATVNQMKLNKALRKDAQKKKKEFLGKVFYTESGKRLPGNFFDSAISNTQNPNPSAKAPVRYGIAVNVAPIKQFPMEERTLDGPGQYNLDNSGSAVARVNDPVLIYSTSRDGKYYYAETYDYRGWMPIENVAVCRDRSEWEAAWNMPQKEMLVVTTDRIHLESSLTDPAASEKVLTVGTRLRLVKHVGRAENFGTRGGYNNYVVYLPVRHADGSYAREKTLVSESESVSIGYLPLTKKSILTVAFTMLGNTYGYCSDLYSEDCSGLVQGVYRCFGLFLPRNTFTQTPLKCVRRYDLTKASEREKKKVLNKLPVGSTIYFSQGHTGIYLGKVGGKHYVINSSNNGRFKGQHESMLTNEVMIEAIEDVRNHSNQTWFKALTYALVPYEEA